MTTEGDSNLHNAHLPVPPTCPTHRITVGGELQKWPDDPSAPGQAAVLYRLAEILECEAESSRRIQGMRRSTVVDAIERCASITRQFAYRVARKGAAEAMGRMSGGQWDAVTTDDIVRRILVGQFTARAGREPTARELLVMEERDGRELRAGVVACWGLIRQAVRNEEAQG